MNLRKDHLHKMYTFTKIPFAIDYRNTVHESIRFTHSVSGFSTCNGECLDSRIEEERSEMRYTA